MNFAFTPEQEELRATARAFLSQRSTSADVRRAMQSDTGYDADLWRQLGEELAWTAVAIPEACGGLGLGMVELAGLLEVMGEHLLCAPFFASVCLAAPAILCAGSEAQRKEWLSGIAEGRTRAALALAGPKGGTGPDAVVGIARREGREFVLDGRWRHVVDGDAADLLVIAARAEGTRGAEGVSLFAVPGDAPGLARDALPTMDRTRRLGEVELAGARVPAASLLGEEGGAGPALERALDLAAVALAAEQVGGAQRCLDLAVEHAKGRQQFGRPIGSFQAIQHRCAETMVRVESARTAAYWAACTADESPDELPAAASAAKATASEAFFRAAADSLQVHGGVGFTWEYDVHLYLKRARAGEALLGDPAWHRERVARLLGLGA